MAAHDCEVQLAALTFSILSSSAGIYLKDGKSCQAVRGRKRRYGSAWYLMVSGFPLLRKAQGRDACKSGNLSAFQAMDRGVIEP